MNEMDILEAVAQSNQRRQGCAQAEHRKTTHDGLLTISDGVFEATLYRLGVDKETTNWRLLEPPETREKVIEFYERGH